MKKSSFWISAIAALCVAIALAGCGSTEYFAGRQLPPSGLTNRVMVAIQNPSALSRGALQILDAYYDTRFKVGSTTVTYPISGYSGALPCSIQNMPEEQLGAVYGCGDGSFTYVNYQKETTAGTQAGVPTSGSSSIFTTRSQSYVFATAQAGSSAQVGSQLVVIDKTVSSAGSEQPLNLPNVYRVSVNPGGSVALFFAQNSNYVYYPVKLSSAQSQAFAGGPNNWPKAAEDCEPQNQPTWCLFQMQSPDNTDATGTRYGAPLTFDRPVKAVFSNDGSTAYILSCGPECGGITSSVTAVPVSSLIFTQYQGSGVLPTNTALHTSCSSAANLSSCTIPVPGGSSNALVDSSTMYVVGQCPAASGNGTPQCTTSTQTGSGLFTGGLTVLNLAPGTGATITAGSTTSISDGAPGGPSRMIEADDNSLWIAMTKCTNGPRFANGLNYGCLTMYNTSTNSVTTILPYQGDATGIAAVTTLHKIYAAIGGQVYIYTTTDGTALDNQYVSVTGTAYDVAYMDGLSDANNTVY